MFTQCGTDRKPYEQRRVKYLLLSWQSKRIISRSLFILSKWEGTVLQTPAHAAITHCLTKPIYSVFLHLGPRKAGWPLSPCVSMGRKAAFDSVRSANSCQAKAGSCAACCSLLRLWVSPCTDCDTCAASAFQRLMGIWWFVCGFDHGRPATGSKHIAYSFCHFSQFLHWFNQQNLPAESFEWLFFSFLFKAQRSYLNVKVFLYKKQNLMVWNYLLTWNAVCMVRDAERTHVRFDVMANDQTITK